MADADATVWVHPCEPVVLRQLGLSEGGEGGRLSRERGPLYRSLKASHLYIHTEYRKALYGA